MNSNGSEMMKAMTLRALLAALLGPVLSSAAVAQTPPATPATPPAPATAAAPEATGPLAQFAWLAGCWRGSVNKREFREHWLPPRGDLLLGVSHTVMDGKTLDYEYLRIEPRADGIAYVASPPGAKEIAYRLVDAKTVSGGDLVITFANPEQQFPQKLSYRRGTEGWLYATVDGKVAGADRQVIYPMRRVDCETGELIPK